MFDLSGKTALVTGGSRGIGRTAAEWLAKQGARVVLTYARGRQSADEAVAAIEAAGGQGLAEQLDITDFEKTEAAVEAIVRRIGQLDILVANAGVSIDALLLRLKPSDFDTVLDVNVKGALACARAALKPMLKARSGRIIFVSSVVGQTG